LGIPEHVEAYKTKEDRTPMYKLPLNDSNHSYKDIRLVNDKCVVLAPGGSQKSNFKNLKTSFI
jgi:hypothetical protein